MEVTKYFKNVTFFRDEEHNTRFFVSALARSLELSMFTTGPFRDDLKDLIISIDTGIYLNVKTKNTLHYGALPKHWK
jgi:hypothetical protein